MYWFDTLQTWKRFYLIESNAAWSSILPAAELLLKTTANWKFMQKQYSLISNFLQFYVVVYILLIYLPNCLSQVKAKRFRVSCHLLPLKGRGIPLSAFPKDTTSKVAGFISTLYRYCWTLSSIAVNTNLVIKHLV